MIVSAPSLAAVTDDKLLAIGLQIADDLLALRVLDQSSRWHLDPQILARLPRSQSAFARRAVGSDVFRAVREIAQRIQIRIRHQHYIAPLAAVAAVRPPLWDIFFRPV